MPYINHAFNRVVLERVFGGKEKYKEFKKDYPKFRINSGGLDAIIRDDEIKKSQGKETPKESANKHEVCVKTVYNKLNRKTHVPQITLSPCVYEWKTFLH